jgi:hypothetical protein
VGGNQVIFNRRKNMERTYAVGDHVIYVDPTGKQRKAIVNIWWDNYRKVKIIDGAVVEGADVPGCNLVFVTDDALKTDHYGLQLERATSVVHKVNQPAHGNYWIWPEEV